MDAVSEGRKGERRDGEGWGGMGEDGTRATYSRGLDTFIARVLQARVCFLGEDLVLETAENSGEVDCCYVAGVGIGDRIMGDHIEGRRSRILGVLMTI